MPPMASWEYDYQVDNGSPEEFTQTHLKKGINWI
jgi:coproporphyrinogen III oxidase